MRLARTYRWGFASIWPWPLSMAQHSLLNRELDEPFKAVGDRLPVRALQARTKHDSCAYGNGALAAGTTESITSKASPADTSLPCLHRRAQTLPG